VVGQNLAAPQRLPEQLAVGVCGVPAAGLHLRASEFRAVVVMLGFGVVLILHSAGMAHLTPATALATIEGNIARVTGLHGPADLAKA
jgi:hypothetical protein